MTEEIAKALIEHTNLFAASVRASVKSAGMQARNMKCMMRQQQPMYLEEDFLRVLDLEGLLKSKDM